MSLFSKFFGNSKKPLPVTEVKEAKKAIFLQDEALFGSKFLPVEERFNDINLGVVKSLKEQGYEIILMCSAITTLDIKDAELVMQKTGASAYTKNTDYNNINKPYESKYATLAEKFNVNLQDSLFIMNSPYKTAQLTREGFNNLWIQIDQPQALIDRQHRYYTSTLQGKPALHWIEKALHLSLNMAA